MEGIADISTGIQRSEKPKMYHSNTFQSQSLLEVRYENAEWNNLTIKTKGTRNEGRRCSHNDGTTSNSFCDILVGRFRSTWKSFGDRGL